MGKKLSRVERFEAQASVVEDKITKEILRLESELIKEVDKGTRQRMEIKKRIKDGENLRKPSQVFSNLLSRYIITKKSIATTCKTTRVLTKTLYNIKELRERLRTAEIFKDVFSLVKSTNSKLKEVSEKQIDEFSVEFGEIMEKDEEILECLNENHTNFNVDPEDLERELEELTKEKDTVMESSKNTLMDVKKEVMRKPDSKAKKKKKRKKEDHEMLPLLN